MLSQWFVFHWSENFTSLDGIRVPLTVPVNHYSGVRNQQNSTRVLFHYPMLIHARATACLKHSDFLKVKGSAFTPHSQVQLQSLSICQNKTRCSPRGRTGLLQQKSNYELFNRNNFNIRYWSWNYRGCWHQTCPPIDS